MLDEIYPEVEIVSEDYVDIWNDIGDDSVAFMTASINKSCAYFLIDGLSGKEHTKLVQECIFYALLGLLHKFFLF